MDERCARVGAITDAWIDWNLAKEVQIHLFREFLAAALFEDVGDFAAVRAGEAAHVLNDAQNGKVELTAEIDGTADVRSGDFLRRRDDDGFRVWNHLADAERFIACSGRAVDDEIVEFAPFDVCDELLDGALFHRAAPDDGIVAVMEEEGDGDDGDAGGVDGKDLVADGFGHGVLKLQHGRDGRAVQIDVEQADFVAFHGEADGEIDGACAFADAAFAGEHDDLMLDFSELFRDGFGGGVLPAGSVFLGGAGGTVVGAFGHDNSLTINN